MRLSVLVSGLLVAAALLLLYASSFQSMATIWWTSDTFAHGMLVFPISAWLAWNQRDALRGVALDGSRTGLVFVLLLCAAWLVARLAAIQVVEQGAVVLLVPALVWSLYGTQVARTLMFPLGFLLFAVPFGEALIPHLMEFTATFTVAALQVIGIPVLRDGLYFSVPSGDFEVAKACSGIRYLIASIALGVLYAYMTYRSNLRRGLFVAAAVVVPLLANGFRAFGIVLLAHYSDRRLAVGVDHLVYGWLFFGIVMFALFWVGSWFREDGMPEARDAVIADRARGDTRVPVTRVAVVIAVLLIAPLVHIGIAAAEARDASTQVVALPAGMDPWRGPSQATPDAAWQPVFAGASRSLSGNYRTKDARVMVRVEHYDRQQQGAELINDVNQVYDTVYWARLTQGWHEVVLDSGEVLRVRSERLRHDNASILIWYWYRVGSFNESRAAMVKARELWQRLTLRGSRAAMIAIGIAENGNSELARKTLGDFVKLHYQSLNACVGGQVSVAGCAQ